MNSIYLSLILFALIIASSLAGGPAMPSCQEWCTEEYTPLCASNGENLKTFGNNCELTRYNCQNHEAFGIVYEGECNETKCVKGCTKEFMPVCAIKDNEKFAFGNECIFEIENCKNKGAFKLLLEENCDISSATFIA